MIDRDGRVQPHQAVAVWNAELPPDPDKRETMLHEEAVAEISFRRGVGNLRPTVDVLNDVLPAAIEHIEQGGAVATRRLLRRQHIEIRPEFHEPPCIAGRLLDVDDGPVVRISGIDDKKYLPDDFLVGTRRAERLSTQHIDP